MRRRLLDRSAGALAVRAGEGRVVALLAAAFASVEAGRGIGEVAALSLVLDRSGAGALPPLYIALGLVALVVTLAFGAAVGRSRSSWLFPVWLLGAAVLIAAEGVLAATLDAVAVDGAAWVTVFTASTLLTTILWTVAGRTLDARQAKRLFPLCTAAAIAGGFLGLLAAGPMAHIVGLEALLVGQALLVSVGAVALHRLRPHVRRPSDGVGAGSRSPLAAGRYVLHSPLLRLVCLAYLLFAVLLFSMAYPFSAAMAAAFADPADLASALGLLAAAVTAASFLLATTVANRVYARLGVATVAALLPAVYLFGFGVWALAFTTATAIGAKFVQETTQRGLSNTAWSALFTVVPTTRRGPVLAFVDGVPGQLGTVLSGLLLLAVATLPSSGPGSGSAPLFALGAAAALACLVVVLLVRRRYAATLLATLRERPGEQVLDGGPGLMALTRVPGLASQLRAALGSDLAADRRLAAELAGELLVAETAPDLTPLVADPDPAVRRAALQAMGALDGPLPLDGGMLDRLAGDPDPQVRAALAVALCRREGSGAGNGIIEALLGSPAPTEQVAGLDAVARLGPAAPPIALEPVLRSGEPAVRAAALRALGAVPPGAGPTADRVTDVAVAGLGDRSADVRDASSTWLAGRPDAAERLVALIRDGPDAARDAALAVLDARAPRIRTELVGWASGQADRAAGLREHTTRLTGAGPGAAFLADVLRRRAATIETRLLAALAALGAPELAGPVRRSLRSVDPEVRAQAVEAVDALGEGPLGRAVVRLLDSEATRSRDAGGDPAPAAVSSARALLDDPDPWVHTLALRTLVDLDAVPAGGGAGMTDARSTLDDVDRMLLLRRVPLFAALDAGDVQRFAARAVEQVWEGGEPLVRQDEPGEDLVVITEGSVRVLVQDPGAQPRLIRRYGAGDHIGELAILRGTARSASVLADEPGVRGLVLSGESVRAILAERPDAAMAMLATLAERISRQ